MRRRVKQIEGTAAVAGHLNSSEGDLRGRGTGALQTAVVTAAVTRDAMKAALARLRDGQGRCALRLNHGGHRLAWFDGDAFDLFLKGDRLRVRIRGSTRRGRDVLDLLREWPSRELSPGWRVRASYPLPGAAVPTFIVTDADLTEVAIVKHAGGGHGCRFDPF